MPRTNRADPWGDLHAVDARGLFTGNRGCLVNADGQVVRHHQSQLWITCVTAFRGWRQPLAAPRRWTPVFFLDEAVALAAGHRPCATCRRQDYHAYRDAVGRSAGAERPLRAYELDALLVAERHRRGRGMARWRDRLLWRAQLHDLPAGTVVVDADGGAHLLTGAGLHRFGFDGWGPARPWPGASQWSVLTPPTSVAALRHGFRPVLHGSAVDDSPSGQPSAG